MHWHDQQGAKVKRVLILATALTITAIACDGGGDDPGTTAAAGGEEENVEIVDLAFNPEEVTITAGSTVTWTHADPNLPHTATSDDDVFDSGNLTEGDEFSFTFEEAGTFPYFCQVHPTMRGTVIVE
jgi:plastocyanin